MVDGSVVFSLHDDPLDQVLLHAAIMVISLTGLLLGHDTLGDRLWRKRHQLGMLWLLFQIEIMIIIVRCYVVLLLHRRILRCSCSHFNWNCSIKSNAFENKFKYVNKKEMSWI